MAYIERFSRSVHVGSRLSNSQTKICGRHCMFSTILQNICKKRLTIPSAA